MTNQPTFANGHVYLHHKFTCPKPRLPGNPLKNQRIGVGFCGAGVQIEEHKKSGKMKRVPKYFLPPSLRYTKLALVAARITPIHLFMVQGV